MLLVSVRSAAESLVALAGGASIIDIKEPANGSLGPAARSVQVDIVRALDAASEGGRELTVTAALGELLSAESPSSWSPVRGLSLYKLGLSGCGGRRDWPERLDAWRDRVRTGAADLAAVAYGDHAAARAPRPREVLDYAVDRRLPFLLIDTFGKRAGSLTAHLGESDIAILVEEAHRHDVAVALAGSLELGHLRPLARLGADVLAVRGAACRDGNRELDLDPDRIRELVRLVGPVA